MSNDRNDGPKNLLNHGGVQNDPANRDPEAEQVVTLPGKAPTPTDDALHSWFAAQHTKSLDNLEAGARQIIALCTTLLTILLGLIALTGSAPPIYTQNAIFQWLSLIGVVGLFLALFCALMVVIPSSYRVAINDPDEVKRTFGAIFQHKSAGLNLAVMSFIIAMFCLTGMIVGALLVWYGWL